MSDQSADVSGQIFGVRANEIFLFNQNRLLRSVHRSEGWTPSSVAAHAIPTLRAGFTKLERSPDVFTWDPDLRNHAMSDRKTTQQVPRKLFDADHRDLPRQRPPLLRGGRSCPTHDQWEEQGYVESRRLAEGRRQRLPVRNDARGLQAAPAFDRLYSTILIEEGARVGASGSGLLAALGHRQQLPAQLRHREQKQAYLPAMARGEKIGAIAMTEPGAGSDLQSIRTTAKRDGDEWVINGSKTFITNGYNADLVVPVARAMPSSAPRARACSWSMPTGPASARDDG
jgi:alkylation response protein AidB-like acyl-CoA dehydrogenase